MLRGRVKGKLKSTAWELEGCETVFQAQLEIQAPVQALGYRDVASHHKAEAATLRGLHPSPQRKSTSQTPVFSPPPPVKEERWVPFTPDSKARPVPRPQFPQAKNSGVGNPKQSVSPKCQGNTLATAAVVFPNLVAPPPLCTYTASKTLCLQRENKP